MLAKIETVPTFGAIWQRYIDANKAELNKTAAARRHRLDEAKLRYWLKGGSPTVDYLIAARNAMPAQVMADLINVLADGAFVVAPVDRTDVAADPVKQVIGLHGPVNEYVQEVVNAYQDGIVTSAEESRITARYQAVRTSLHTTYVTVIVRRVRRVVSRVWRVA